MQVRFNTIWWIWWRYANTCWQNWSNSQYMYALMCHCDNNAFRSMCNFMNLTLHKCLFDGCSFSGLCRQFKFDSDSILRFCVKLFRSFTPKFTKSSIYTKYRQCWTFSSNTITVKLSSLHQLRLFYGYQSIISTPYPQRVTVSIGRSKYAFQIGSFHCEISKMVLIFANKHWLDSLLTVCQD